MEGNVWEITGHRRVTAPCRQEPWPAPFPDQRQSAGGALGRIRTCALRLRRPTLYPLSYEGGGASAGAMRHAESSGRPLAPHRPDTRPRRFAARKGGYACAVRTTIRLADRPDDDEQPPAGETDQQRLDREHEQLFHELRSIIPGVQIQGAFLLTVAFTQRFETSERLPARRLLRHVPARRPRAWCCCSRRRPSTACSSGGTTRR